MADRVLTWHFPGSVVAVENKTDVNVRYFADQDYRPIRIVIVAKTAPLSGQTIVDIKKQVYPAESSGSSIFGSANFRPELQAHQAVLVSDIFWNGGAGIGIPKDSIITIDIPDWGPECADMTVHLELETN